MSRRILVTQKILAVTVLATAAATGCATQSGPSMTRSASPSEVVVVEPPTQPQSAQASADVVPAAAATQPAASKTEPAAAKIEPTAAKTEPAAAKTAPAAAPTQPAKKELTDAERQALSNLRGEFHGLDRASVLKRAGHFRPLCDKDGYALVGNMGRKSMPDYTVAEFCAEVQANLKK